MLLATQLDQHLEWITNMITMKNWLIVLLISVLNGILVLFSSQRYMLALQQLGYSGKKYYAWLYKKGNNQLSRLLLLCLMSFLFFCIWNMSLTAFFKPSGENGALSDIPAYMGFIVYLLFMAVYIGTESSVRKKMPLKGTKRIVRLGVLHVILVMIFTFAVCVFVNAIAYLFKSEVLYIMRYALISFVPVIAPFVLLLANTIIKPFEKLNEKRYVKIAKDKLDKSDIIKIGITGSFGKTGVKTMLSTILAEKYRVLATPKSYNTPLGISLAVKKLDSTHDVFIAEMGARKQGDIRDLAAIVNPDIAVLTGINEQHLETFKNLDNIKETKFELFDHLKEGGKGFFSSDNKYSVELGERFEGEKYFGGINALNGQRVYAKDIETTEKGAAFNLVIDGKEYYCVTSLLGRHNVTNIALAASVAVEMGLTPEEIQSGINKIRTVTHRLSLVPNNKGIVIIDDSYNSNTDGFQAAIEVIKEFQGRKIVVTPGMVELGEKQPELNERVGEMIAEVFDKVIIIGKTNAEALIKGLFNKGKAKEDIYFEKNSERGNAALNGLIQKGDIILFENDLPDTYY